MHKVDKVDIADPFELQAATVINDIERDIRNSLPHYKIYIYIEVDEFKKNYQRA